MPETNERALSMLDMAMKMEEKGRKYYEEAAAKTKNPVGRDIWKLLAGYEVEHMSRIREIYSSLQNDKHWKKEQADFEPAADLSGMLRDLAARQAQHIRADTGDMEALQVGMDFESASVKFYEEHLSGAADDMEKKFLKAMVSEERVHLRLLADMKLYYMDPESWFQEKGRITLDGA